MSSGNSTIFHSIYLMKPIVRAEIIYPCSKRTLTSVSVGKYAGRVAAERGLLFGAIFLASEGNEDVLRIIRQLFASAIVSDLAKSL